MLSAQVKVIFLLCVPPFVWWVRQICGDPGFKGRWLYCSKPTDVSVDTWPPGASVQVQTARFPSAVVGWLLFNPAPWPPWLILVLPLGLGRVLSAVWPGAASLFWNQKPIESADNPILRQRNSSATRKAAPAINATSSGIKKKGGLMSAG